MTESNFFILRNQRWLFGFIWWVKKPYRRNEASLAIGRAQTQVFADRMTIAASALNQFSTKKLYESRWFVAVSTMWDSWHLHSLLIIIINKTMGFESIAIYQPPIWCFLYLETSLLKTVITKKWLECRIVGDNVCGSSLYHVFRLWKGFFPYICCSSCCSY